MSYIFGIFFFFFFLFMQLFLKILHGMANSADSDQTAPSGAVWSESALFAHAILLGTVVYEILGHLPYQNYVVVMFWHSFIEKSKYL